MFKQIHRSAVVRFITTYALAALGAIAMAVGCSPQPAAAQTMKVATGPKLGTYSTMLKEVSSACSMSGMSELSTDGSMSNIDLLVGNQVNAAFVQTDVLFFRARTENLSNVKTLLTLHPEEVHIVTLVNPKKEGGVMGIGAKQVSYNSILDLANRNVGASGGSYVTAQVIRLQSEIPFQVVNMPSNNHLIDAIAKGELDAGIIVGGSPLNTIAALDPRFKLVGIPEQIQSKLKSVYNPAKLTYAKIGAAGVPSVSTDAVFVTREYKTQKMLGALSDFRRCATKAIPEIKETLGTHPKWQAVDPSNHGKWAWYDLK
jgi:TRAP-type uncharacterized transport system substrate-binding protein